MKITFNPTIKTHQTYFKPSKTGVLNSQKQTNLNGLDCLANYNLSFKGIPKAVYVINYDGSYERFESKSEVVTKERSNAISCVLNGKSVTSGDKTYVYAKDIELENGKVDRNAFNKALLAFKEGNRQAIYAIDLYGNIQRFDNIAQASKALNIATTAISSTALGKKDSASEYVFIKAFDVELRDKNGKLLKDDDGNAIIDIDRINKLREKLLFAKYNYPIIRIDKDGNTKQYKYIKEACADLNTRKEYIGQSILYSKILDGKQVFAYLKDVVQIDEFGDVMYDENNDFMIDYDKVEQIRQMVFKK